jgi:hypothetical protein
MTGVVPTEFCADATHTARLAWHEPFVRIGPGEVVHDRRAPESHWLILGFKQTQWISLDKPMGQELVLCLRRALATDAAGSAAVELEDLALRQATSDEDRGVHGWIAPTLPPHVLLIKAGRLAHEDVERLLAWAEQHPACFARLDRAGLEAVLGKTVDPELRFEIKPLQVHVPHSPAFR